MDLTEPDLRFHGFSLWIFRYQFADATDDWDSNWLNVLARVEAPGALVQAGGPIISTLELSRFADELDVLDQSLTGEAKLKCLNHNLGIEVRCDALGHVTFRVDITPDQWTQSHRFDFELDQTYLRQFLRDCRGALARWPIR